MKFVALAAALAVLPAALPAFGDQAAPAQEFQAKTDLLDELEAWRATQLPHLTPPSKLDRLFEPRLNELAAQVKQARVDADLDEPRRDFDSWKRAVMEMKYATAQSQGLTHESYVQYYGEEAQRAAFSADLHAMIVQTVAQKAVARIERQAASAAVQNPAMFFDGTGPGASAPLNDPSVLAAPAGALSPSRYSKVRQILISQGKSPRVVDMAVNEAMRQGADPMLVLAVINQESSFRTHATSYKRDREGRLILDADGHPIPIARGLMQIVPKTGRELGVQDSGMLYDAQTNLHAGISYLISLISRFGSLKNALAAYNAGPHAVDKYGGVPPYQETQGYVQRVLAYYSRYKEMTVTEV